ncbi:MAG: hypothetical protein IPO81_00020 [Kouleothrix sp.]|nr:hypothetical protein [Kouleothrix sp.]
MSEHAQVVRWRFESEHASLIVYHEGQRIAQFAGGVFETADGEIAAALRGFGAYCREVAAPILAPSTEAAGTKPAKTKLGEGR